MKIFIEYLKFNVLLASCSQQFHKMLIETAMNLTRTATTALWSGPTFNLFCSKLFYYLFCFFTFQKKTY